MRGEISRQDAKNAKEEINLFVETIDDSGNPMLHDCLTEIQQVSKSLVSAAKIGQDLLLVGVVESLYALELEDDLVFNNEIDPKTFIESESLVSSWKRELSFHAQAAASQFVCEDDFVHRLQEARPHLSMEVHCDINDQPANLILFHLCLSLAFLASWREQYPGHLARAS
jgi:hypothetical protein